MKSILGLKKYFLFILLAGTTAVLFGQKIQVERGILQFDSMEHLGETLEELDKLDGKRLARFEARFDGFTSTKSYAEEVENMLEEISEKDVSNEMIKKVMKGINELYIHDNEFDEIIISPSLGTVVNKDGQIQIGQIIYQFSHEGLSPNTLEKINRSDSPCKNGIYNRHSEYTNQDKYRLRGVIEYINLGFYRKINIKSKFRKRFAWIYWPHKADVITAGGSAIGLITVNPPVGSSFSVNFNVPYGSDADTDKNKVTHVNFEDWVGICENYCIAEIKSKHTASKSGNNLSLNMSF